MFEVTYKITALAEIGEQGKRVFHVVKQAYPLDDEGFLSFVTRVYEQDVYRMLQVGDDLTVTVHLDLPPRTVEETLLFLGDRGFEKEGEAKPITDPLSLITSRLGVYRQLVQSGDVLTISFRIQRH